jgi:hypothetical protein
MTAEVVQTLRLPSGGRSFGQPERGNVRAFRLERSIKRAETLNFRANVRACPGMSSIT